MNQYVKFKWTKEHEDILRQWKARCFVSLWLQLASGYYYNKLYNWLSYPVIIMSSLSSAALFSSDDSIMKFLLGIITMSCGILTSVTRQLKPGELYQDHASISKRYLNLIRNIDMCLSTTLEMRPDPQVFLEKIGQEIDTLETTQLDPPLLIVRRFEKKYGPIHRVLYGDDIVELMKIEMEASTLYQKMRSEQRLSDISSSDNKDNRSDVPSYDSFHRTLYTIGNKKESGDSDLSSRYGQSIHSEVTSQVSTQLSRQLKQYLNTKDDFVEEVGDDMYCNKDLYVTFDILNKYNQSIGSLGHNLNLGGRPVAQEPKLERLESLEDNTESTIVRTWQNDEKSDGETNCTGDTYPVESSNELPSVDTNDRPSANPSEPISDRTSGNASCHTDITAFNNCVAEENCDIK
jgi:hypothetical protein